MSNERCKLCGSYAINPGHHGRPEWKENVDHDLCDTCFWKARYDRVRSLLRETIQCIPGHAGAGDFSREQRVRAECIAALGDDMPLTLDEHIALKIPPGFVSVAEYEKVNKT